MTLLSPTSSATGALPLLYTYRRCPYAMRARMALLVSQMAFCAHEIDLKNKPSALLKASPKGTVPVLVQSNGVAIEQSWDIVQWALTHPSAPDLAHQWWALAQTPDHLSLLERNDGDFKRHLDRYKYPERHLADGPEAQAATRENNRNLGLHVLLLELEQRLADADFLGGDAPCATDIGLFPFVRQFAAVDANWFAALALPHVQTWLAHWTGGSLFAQCMHKLPANQPTPFPKVPNF